MYLTSLDVGATCSYAVSSLSWSLSMHRHNYKPPSFFIDLGAKTSKCNSLFGPTSFFHSCFEREQAQNSQNSRQELQICSLSTKNRSCGRTNTGLIQKCPRVNRVWRDAGFDTHLSYKDTLNQALQCRAHTHAEI